MIDPSHPSVTLIRHGPPTVSLSRSIRGRDFRRFMERYEEASISLRKPPPQAVKTVMGQAHLVFASHRPRALHTAELLETPMEPIVDPRFREIEFPVDFPAPFKLSAFTWTVIAVLLWRIGYSPRRESIWLARRRARTMAELLVSKAEVSGPVVLVAHGGINRLLAKELRRQGLQGPRLPHSLHWGCTTYSFPGSIP